MLHANAFPLTLLVCTAAFASVQAGASFPAPATAYDFSKIRMEKLNRGLVAVRKNYLTNFISWRSLRKDPAGLGFNLYANDWKLNAEPITNVTWYSHRINPKSDYTYELRYVYEGREIAPKHPIRWLQKAECAWGAVSIPITPPAEGYKAGDVECGDADGDGEYEYVIKWNARHFDNAHSGYADPVIFECVKLDGTSLWKLDLGVNVRAGEHYNPFVFYDLDGDGSAELVVKTAPKSPDLRNEGGRILQGPEWLSVFSGRTGEELARVDYEPGRGDVASWGDDWGNRCDRFLATPAYLDGVHPSVVMCRGYYARTALVAWDWDGKQLKKRWTFDTADERWKDYAGQGFHNLRVADVDFDGRDEIIYGAMAVDDDGTGLYTTGLGHGDAMQLFQISPKAKGLQVWTCQEAPPYGLALRSARTGKIYRRYLGEGDTGRCQAGDIDTTSPGVEMWGMINDGFFTGKGERFGDFDLEHCANLVWWTGDLARDFLPHHYVDTFDGVTRTFSRIANFKGSHTINGTKCTPNLQADLFGDWREEVVLTSDDEKWLKIFVSTEETPYRFHTFMQDPVYRISVANENAGYNACPMPGFYFGPDLLGHGIIFRGMKLD